MNTFSAPWVLLKRQGPVMKFLRLVVVNFPKKEKCVPRQFIPTSTAAVNVGAVHYAFRLFLFLALSFRLNL